MLKKSLIVFCLCLQILFLCFKNGKAFNIDESIPIIKQGINKSLFGLTVEQHYVRSSPSSLKDIVLLVGAPKASRAFFQTEDSVNPGGLYKCDISYDKSSCARVRVDDGANTFQVNNSNSWLGVSVKSQKPGGKVAVCAHRYTIHGGNPSRGIWEAEIGRCFLLTNQLTLFLDNPTIEPCIGKVDADGSYSQAGFGYCQAGTSFDFADNREEDLALGIPGMIQWSGGIYSTQLNSDVFVDSMFGNDKDQLNRLKQDISYVGMSVSSFTRNSKVAFAAGAPRGNDTGQVLVFEPVVHEEEKKFNITEVIQGEVLASAFGYDLEIIDVNGDGKEDLIVGSPQYYNRLNKQGGAVYVFLQNKENKFGSTAATVLYGELDSTFGISISNLGDINKDGFNDIAIGASGAEDGVGEVYIYHGSSSGIELQPSQVIKPSNIPSLKGLTVKGFGYSLSGGLDMDLNEYPDLAVGSLSDVVVLFRSSPIVEVRALLETSLNKVNINATAQFNPNAETIPGPSGKLQKVVTFDINTCSYYTSRTSNFDKVLNVTYTITLDVERLKKGFTPRVSFVPFKNVPNKIFNLLLSPQSENNPNCIKQSVYLDNNMQDKLSPFVMSVTYELVKQDSVADSSIASFPSMDNFPVIEKLAGNNNFTQVNISKNCGEDEICTSNLNMNAEYVVLPSGKSNWETLAMENSMSVLFVGAEKQIGLRVNITNFPPGEDAHQAKLKILFPDFLSFVRISTTAAAVSCQQNETNTTMEVCNIGNPFRSGVAISLIILFDSDDRLYEMSNFIINLALSTSSVQEKLSFQPFPVSVKVEAYLSLKSYTTLNTIRFGGEVIGESAVKEPSDAGLKIAPTYEIYNEGSFEVGPVVINISWPYALKNNKWLFYLLKLPSSSSENSNLENQILCQVSPKYFNPLNLGEFGSRKKRDTTVEEKPSIKVSKSVRSSKSHENLTCPNSAKCTSITCNLGMMTKGQVIRLVAEGIVWNSTFIEEYNGVADIKVFSQSNIFVNRSNVLYADASSLKTTLAITLSSENIVPPKQEVQWWIIAVATLGGVICLVFLVLLLWRCGFFNRRRNQGDYHKAQKRRQASKQADAVTDKLVY